MLVVSKCPYRISLLGGSSDIDWYLKEKQYGNSIGFSINKFSAVTIQKKEIGERGVLNYSSREEYSEISFISHPLIRETLRKLEIEYPVELASFGSGINGGGLGGSSSFLVALIMALSKLKNANISNKDAAKLACEIEIDILKNPIGRQDQYLCALGGVNILSFLNKEVSFEKNKKIENCINSYVKNLVLINTNLTRSASVTLKEMRDTNIFDKITSLRDIADNFIKKAEISSLTEMEILLEKSIEESWLIKKSMHNVMNSFLFEFESKLNFLGLKVLKLCGAGNGGYFLAKPIIDNKKARLNLIREQISFSDIEISEKGAQVWEH